MSLPEDLPFPGGATNMRYMQRLMAKSVVGVAALERGVGPIITGWVVVASLVCGLRLGFARAMPGSEAMEPAIFTGFATYALVVASPAVFLALALRWFSEPALPPARRFAMGPVRWRQISPAEASRHRLYGPYGIMFSLLIGILLNVPVRTLEYLGAIPPLPDAAPLWLRTLSALCLADVVVFSAFYAICFAAALKRHPVFPGLLMAVWAFDFTTQFAIKSLIHIVPGTPAAVAAAATTLFDGNTKKVLISMTLWLPYLLLSRRINVTYRHRIRS